MKKVGFGTRPSELKGRDKKIDFETEGIKTPQERTSLRKPDDKPAVKIILISALILAGVLFACFFLFGSSFDRSLDRVEFVLPEKELRVKDGESFKVNYNDGIIYKRTVMAGFYRLFPPDDIVFQIDGVSKPVINDEDLTVFLQPEKKTSYEITISQKGEAVGKLSFSLEMDSKGWIKRAESADDKGVRVDCYKKAVSLDPDSEDVHIALGHLYESEKKLKSASSEFEAVVKINPKNVMALKSLVKLYKKRGVKKRLVHIYEKLGEADTSQSDEYYYQGGILAEQVFSRSSALTFYRKSLNENRKHLDARQRLIKIYEHDKQWKRAARNTKVLIELDPKNPDLYLYISDLYLKMNNKKLAAESAEKAEKLKPGNAAICLQLAHIYEKGKDYDKAAKYYVKSIKLNRKNDAAYNNLGLLLEKKGKVKDAIKNYKSAVALKPKNTGYLINLADAYEKDKKWHSAVNTYDKVVKVDKKNKAAWEAIASIAYDKLKSKWKVLSAYQALSKIEPKKIIWHQKTADLYENLGKLSKAKKEYEAILKIDPKNKRARKRYVEISKMKVINGSI